MTGPSLTVTGVGLACSLGLRADDACAAAHAGLTRPTPMPGLDVLDPAENEGTDLPVHAAPLIVDGFVGMTRFARLGTAALADLVRTTEVPDDGKTGICVALPSQYHLRAYEDWALTQEDLEGVVDPENRLSDLRTADLKAFLIPTLKRYADVPLHPSDGATLFQDEAGFGALLRIADQALQGGVLKRCLVGGIDSMLDPETIHARAEAGVLLTPENAGGAMPGEAAAFLLVERAGSVDRGRRTDSEPLVSIGGVAQTQGVPLTREREDRPAGVALSECLAASRSTLAEDPETVYTGLNGTPHRAFDWGCARVRLQADDVGFEGAEVHPATSIGDVGAAAGPVAVCLAAHARQRRWTDRPSVVWLASDSGLRASFTVN